MHWQYILKWVKSDYFKLVPILGLAFYLAFIPHQSSPYPVHVDEWAHISCSNEVIKEAKAFNLTDPFQGGEPVGNQLLETGFHTLASPDAACTFWPGRLAASSAPAESVPTLPRKSRRYTLSSSIGRPPLFVDWWQCPPTYKERYVFM